MLGVYLDGGADEAVSPHVAEMLLLAQYVPFVLERLLGRTPRTD